jgi:hypothetical protein
MCYSSTTSWFMVRRPTAHGMPGRQCSFRCTLVMTALKPEQAITLTKELCFPGGMPMRLVRRLVAPRSEAD